MERTYFYTLGVVVEQVEMIESAIRNMEQAMRHVSPATVDVIRRNKNQLESLLERIMDANVSSTPGLQASIEGNKQCLQDCFSADYTNRLSTIRRTRR
ncbi:MULTISPECIES: hypothetical protein [unclassified Paenibacillus]|uniref:hypothetical protein n=1 Tax=unclassified Paenibacillus TaxID=185978 RepID=UPI000463ABDB|nr:MULTISPECIES: hypothetical protein [unclassified Paenibacillus]KGP82398.1 hypothetical protein P364_0111835 [Paenibacillus sp. MAEPY2]KGP89310.1 hypothetical protein P363_0103150 [Paenibacillus sp. MAEPY1]